MAIYLGGTTPSPLDPKYHGFWYSFGVFSDPATYAKLPNTLVIVTLVSNFGTFLLYMLTCITAIVAFGSTTCSAASSTCSCRCSAWWPT